MKLVNHGVWSQNELSPDDPKKIAHPNIIFYSNDLTGVDYYEYKNRNFGEDTILVATNEEGQVFEVSRGLGVVFPMTKTTIWEVIPEDGEEIDHMSLLGKTVSFKTKKFKKDVIPVPMAVTSAQIKIAIHQYRASLYNLFNEVIRDTEDIPLKIYFTDSQFWERDSQYVIKLTELLGITPAIMDRLFIDAQNIR